MNFIMRILISTAAVLLTGWIMPDDWVQVDGIVAALIVAVVLAFLNQVVKPILIILTIPVTFATLGLFLLAINAGVIMIADYFVEGFRVGGFWSALGFSIVLSIVNALLGGNRNGNNKNGGVNFRFQKFDNTHMHHSDFHPRDPEQQPENDNENRPRLN
jgi:putative membrane protein